VLVTVISSVYVLRKNTKALLGCAGYGVHIWRPDQFWEIHFRATSGKINCIKELNLLKGRISGSAKEIGLSKMEKLTLSRNWSKGPLLPHPENRRNVRGDQFIDRKGELRPACILGLTIFSKPISLSIPGITPFSKLTSAYNPCNLANPRML